MTQPPLLLTDDFPRQRYLKRGGAGGASPTTIAWPERRDLLDHCRFLMMCEEEGEVSRGLHAATTSQNGGRHPPPSGTAAAAPTAVRNRQKALPPAMVIVASLHRRAPDTLDRHVRFLQEYYGKPHCRMAVGAGGGIGGGFSVPKVIPPLVSEWIIVSPLSEAPNKGSSSTTSAVSFRREVFSTTVARDIFRERLCRSHCPALSQAWRFSAREREATLQEPADACEWTDDVTPSGFGVERPQHPPSQEGKKGVHSHHDALLSLRRASLACPPRWWGAHPCLLPCTGTDVRRTAALELLCTVAAERQPLLFISELSLAAVQQEHRLHSAASRVVLDAGPLDATTLLGVHAEWLATLQPTAALIPFQLPYAEDDVVEPPSSAGTDVVGDSAARANSTTFLNGRLMLPIWGGATSTETRMALLPRRTMSVNLDDCGILEGRGLRNTEERLIGSTVCLSSPVPPSCFSVSSSSSFAAPSSSFFRRFDHRCYEERLCYFNSVLRENVYFSYPPALANCFADDGTVSPVHFQFCVVADHGDRDATTGPSLHPRILHAKRERAEHEGRYHPPHPPVHSTALHQLTPVTGTPATPQAAGDNGQSHSVVVASLGGSGSLSSRPVAPLDHRFDGAAEMTVWAQLMAAKRLTGQRHSSVPRTEPQKGVEESSESTHSTTVDARDISDLVQDVSHNVLRSTFEAATHRANRSFVQRAVRTGRGAEADAMLLAANGVRAAPRWWSTPTPVAA